MPAWTISVRGWEQRLAQVGYLLATRNALRSMKVRNARIPTEEAVTYQKPRSFMLRARATPDRVTAIIEAYLQVDKARANRWVGPPSLKALLLLPVCSTKLK